MKHTIENYRGFDIYFDTDYEKFQCIITDDLSKESISYKAIKKFIDDYKKENQSFTPFWIVRTPESYLKKEKIKVTGQRKDGRFIGERNGEKIQISDYDTSRYMIYSEEMTAKLDEIDKLDEAKEEYIESYNKSRKAIIASMNIITLKEYKQTL